MPTRRRRNAGRIIRDPAALTPGRTARDDRGMARHRIFAGCPRFPSGAPHVRAAALLLLWCAALLWCKGAFGQSEDDAHADLQRVRARLDAIAYEIAQAQEERDALTRALARSEKQAAEIRHEITDLDERLSAARRRAEATRHAHTRKRAELEGRRGRLARAVRASYRFARRDPVAMLLDLESPTEIDRVLAYHTIVERAHVSMIHGIADTVAGLAALEATAAGQAASTATLRGRKAAQAREAGTPARHAVGYDPCPGRADPRS